MIISLILIPIIGAIFNLILANKNINQVKKSTLITTIITFLISILIYLSFNDLDNNFVAHNTLYLKNGGLGAYNISLNLDGISLIFILLTTMIFPISVLSSWNSVNIRVVFFYTNLLILEALIIIVFLVSDLILFYIFFEATLIPLYFIIIIWGSKARIRAGYLLFLYTLLGSLFMLMAFIFISIYTGTTNINNIIINSLTSELSLKVQCILFFSIFISLAVKTPLVPFHLWLFRAHAEAPVAGSILLASIVLKLATYAFLRILIPLLPDATLYLSPIVQTFAVLSIIYASLSTMRQTDMKQFVAYSSVAHMGVVVLGLFSNSLIGISGSILLSIAHGFVSPALFFLLGGVLYDTYHTRIIMYYRGLSIYMPLFSVFFFIFTLCNTGVPLSLNWLGELFCLQATINNNIFIGILASSSILLSAAYSFFVFNRMVFGTWSPYLSYNIDLNRREFNILLPLFIFTIIFGIYPAPLLSIIECNIGYLII